LRDQLSVSSALNVNIKGERSRSNSPSTQTGGPGAVRSRIVELQERERDESLPAFDSLFKDALPSSSGAEFSLS
jgi:hypothetical protein